MKKKQLLEIKNRSKAELEKELHDLRDRFWNLKNDLASGKIKNIKEMKVIKKSIAQILTVISLKFKD